MEKLVVLKSFFSNSGEARKELDRLKRDNPDFIHTLTFVKGQLQIKSIKEQQYINERINNILDKAPSFSFSRDFMTKF